MLILTHNLTGLLVVQLPVPEKESEEWEGEQEDEANPNKHVRCESRKVQALGTGNRSKVTGGFRGSGAAPRPRWAGFT